MKSRKPEFLFNMLGVFLTVCFLSSCATHQAINVKESWIIAQGDNINVTMLNGKKIRNFKVISASRMAITGFSGRLNNSVLDTLRINQIQKIEIVRVERQRTSILTTVGLLAIGLIVAIIIELNSLSFSGLGSSIMPI